mgnify:CR=1 FL=1
MEEGEGRGKIGGRDIYFESISFFSFFSNNIFSHNMLPLHPIQKSMIGAKGGEIYILKVFYFFHFFKTIFSVITCYHFTPSYFKCHFWIPHDILLQKMYTFMGVALILVTMCWNKLGRCHIFKILPRNAKGGEFKTRGHI